MFRYRNFKNIGYNNSETPAVYSYETTEDTIAQVSVSGYFSDQRADIREGDLIVARCTDGSTTLTALNSDSVVAMPSAREVAAAIDNQGITPTLRSGSGVSSALIAARSAGKTLVLTHGIYEISTTLVLLSNDKIQINPSATLRAANGFSGTAVIEVGTATVQAENVQITGGGRIDSNGKSNRGISVLFARFSEISNLRVDGALARAISIGSNSASGKSYEVNMSKINCMYLQQENTPSSVCIYYENATDCYLSESVLVGYRKGVEVSNTSYSIELSQCHAWARAVHKALTTCFSVFGDATFSQCNADTPFDITASPASTIYGFYISGTVMGSNLRVYANSDIGTDIQVDDKIIPYYFNGDSESYITLARVHGGSATRRFKSFSGGDTTNNFIVSKIVGATNRYVTPP